MSTLIVIHCHDAALETVLRHKPLWEAHGHEIVYASPENAPLTLYDGERRLHLGQAGHSGAVTNRRFRSVWSWAAAQPGFERVAFFEYDSVCLSKEIPFWNDAMLGNRFNEPDWSRFSSPVYYHAPYVWPMELLRFAAGKFGSVRATADMNYWDRWLGLLLTTHGIPHAGFGKFGASQNTFSENNIHELVDSIRNSAVAIHGIKCEKVLSAAVEAYRQVASP